MHLTVLPSYSTLSYRLKCESEVVFRHVCECLSVHSRKKTFKNPAWSKPTLQSMGQNLPDIMENDVSLQQSMSNL